MSGIKRFERLMKMGSEEEEDDEKDKDKQVIDYKEWFETSEYSGFEESCSPMQYARIIFHDMEIFLKHQGWTLDKVIRYKRSDTIRVSANRGSFTKDGVEHYYYGNGHLYYTKDEERIIVNQQISTWGSSIEIFNEDVDVPEDIWKDFKEYHTTSGVFKRAKFDMNYRFITPRGRTWDDIIMSQAKKDIFRTNVTNVINYNEELNDADIKTCRGIILCGPPGVGKTLTCDALVSEVDETVIYVTNETMQERGDIVKVFNFARKLAPTLIIFEDIDTLGTEQRSLSGGSPLLAEFLNSLDGIEENSGVVTIASTNHSENLDWALLRPGRFEIRVDYDYPDQNKREDLFNMFLEGKSNLDDININGLARACTEHMTGAHIKEVVTHAGLIAGDESDMQDLVIRQKHLAEAMTRTLITQESFSKERGHISGPVESGQWN
ncbi:MAG: ATP-binding protein [Candidatus Poseidoniaceae archaeon]|jgi:AAA+ superfamily predicted ATPase|nr:ATP-binding protein [Candidatus Poseidoniaceae archaeon]